MDKQPENRRSETGLVPHHSADARWPPLRCGFRTEGIWIRRVSRSFAATAFPANGSRLSTSNDVADSLLPYAQSAAISKSHRIPARHSGHAGPADAPVGTAAWSWHRPGDPRQLGRASPGGNRVALSGPAPAAEAGLACF